MSKEKNLKQIPGQRIRRQFFNIPIYFILAIDTALLFAFTADSILEPQITFTHWLEDVGFILMSSAALILPLSILSLLNWFCFGKVICVLDDNGLHYEEGFVSWTHIERAVYKPDFPMDVGRRIYCCNTLHLTAKSFQKVTQIELDHAPLRLLHKIKKHSPGSPCKMTGWGIAMILCLTLGPGIISVLEKVLN